MDVVDEAAVVLDEGEFLDHHLQELVGMQSLRWIFVGGKGGVGKTTTACSLAVKLSELRESVLVISTDPAHNVSDAFGQKFTNTPTLVEGFENLYCMETEVHAATSLPFKIGGDDLGGLSKIFPELLQSLPGIDEAFSFAEMMRSVQTFNHHTIIFDTAPTGHTLRLLGFPELIEKAFKKLAALKDRMSGAFQMFSGMGMEAGQDDDLIGKLEAVRAATAAVRENFADPTRTTFVCVCIPEFLSLYETERLVQELAKHQIDCSNIIVNQVFFPKGEGIVVNRPALLDDPEAAKASTTPEVLEYLMALEKKHEAVNEAYESRRLMQQKYLQQIRSLYAEDFHIVCMPLQNSEVRGMDKMRNFANLLLEDRDLPL